MVFANHGLGISRTGDDPGFSTRGLLFDNNVWDETINDDSGISIFELEDGLRLGGVKMEMVYFDCCLMNMVENLYQIKDLVNYTLGAAHITPGYGGNYVYFLQELENNPGNVTAAMTNYVSRMLTYWTKKDPSYPDVDATEADITLTLSDLSKVQGVVDSWRDFTSLLTAYRQTVDSVGLDGFIDMEYASLYDFDYTRVDTISVYHLDDFTYDMVYYAEQMDAKLKDVDLNSSAVAKAYDDMVVAHGQYYSDDYKAVKPGKFSIGITWLTQSLYNMPDDYSENAFKDIYPLLEFDKQTGWSNYFEANDWQGAETMLLNKKSKLLSSD